MQNFENIDLNYMGENGQARFDHTGLSVEFEARGFREVTDSQETVLAFPDKLTTEQYRELNGDIQCAVQENRERQNAAPILDILNRTLGAWSERLEQRVPIADHLLNFDEEKIMKPGARGEIWKRIKIIKKRSSKQARSGISAK